MTGVKYIGPVLDASGYAEAARNYALAIYEQGYPICVEPISFEAARPDLGSQGELLDHLARAEIDYDKVVLHSTPDTWMYYGQNERDKYRIGYTVWETTALHPVWTQSCRLADEVWVPSRWNKEVFAASGVEQPILVVPHAIDPPDLEAAPAALSLDLPTDAFVFYSIFHWQERKNPAGLLTAYWSAFCGRRDVVLLLKTYIPDRDEAAVLTAIEELRSRLRLPHYPEVVPVVAALSSEQMLALHRLGDCFVLLQRAEGWGLPHFEAAACGNPVITPRFGGQTDFLSDGSAYLVDYTLRPVTGMSWSPYYLGTQSWCEPDLAHAMRLMRHVVDHRDEAEKRGARARRYVSEHFTRQDLGRLIVDRLRQLDGAER